MDTGKDPSFNVHLEKNKIIKFVEIKSGLYMLDVGSLGELRKISGYSFLSLVKGNKANFTRSEISKADMARDMYRKVGIPGHQNFFKLLQQHY